jgi:hypothetical protein
MSLGYSVTVRISMNYAEQNIYLIMKNGISKFNFKYYLIDYIKLNCIGRELNLEEAVEVLINGTPDETLNCIVAKYQDTHFFLHFINEHYYLTIMFSTFFNPWVRSYDGGEDVDISRYISLMLDLVEDYKILELKAEKD